MIAEESHLALKDEMKIGTRRHLAPYGLEEVELQQNGQKLDAAGALYVSLTEYKAMDRSVLVGTDLYLSVLLETRGAFRWKVDSKMR